jgi:type VI secretion system protein ImpK
MRLSDCFMEIIAYAAVVARSNPAAQPPYEQVKNNMQQLIGQSEAMGAGGQFPQDDFQLARFAVFAWVDETILSSQWGGTPAVAARTTAGQILPDRRCG